MSTHVEASCVLKDNHTFELIMRNLPQRKRLRKTECLLLVAPVFGAGTILLAGAAAKHYKQVKIAREQREAAQEKADAIRRKFDLITDAIRQRDVIRDSLVRLPSMKLDPKERAHLEKEIPAELKQAEVNLWVIRHTPAEKFYSPSIIIMSSPRAE